MSETIPIEPAQAEPTCERPTSPLADPRYTGNSKVCVKASAIHGLGVFAQIDIPAFTYIGTYRGPITHEDGMHVLWLYDESLDDWFGIDGENEMRFLNHSSDPNAEWSDVDLYATRWISAGEEITFDYGWDEEEDTDDVPEENSSEHLSDFIEDEPHLQPE